VERKGLSKRRRADRGRWPALRPQHQKLRLVEATPAGYRVRGEVKTHDVWKPTLNLLDMVQPALSRGRLFIRTPDELICYRVVGE
jgi:hypothetical protein